VLRLSTFSTFLFLASCAAPAAGRSFDLVASQQATPRPPDSSLPYQVPTMPPYQAPVRVERRPGMEWHPGQALMQGFFGVTENQKFSVDDGGPGRVDGDKGDLDELPVIGGGAQWKMGGERIDFGLEGMFSFAWSSNATAFVVGGGGAAVAVDVDLLIFEFYGGPFASIFLGDKLRAYGAIGPLFQWTNYDQTGNGLADDGSGFGYGYYARTGIEFALASRTFLGFGVRWSDSTADLGGSLGDLEMEGLQALITVSRGL